MYDGTKPNIFGHSILVEQKCDASRRHEFIDLTNRRLAHCVPQMHIGSPWLHFYLEGKQLFQIPAKNDMSR